MSPASGEEEKWTVFEDEIGWWLYHPRIVGLLFGQGESAHLNALATLEVVNSLQQDNERLREALGAEKAKSERLLFHRNELRRRIVGVLDEGWVGLEMSLDAALTPTPEAKQG